MNIKEAVRISINHSVAWSTGLMKLYELLINSAEGVEASEGVVAGKVGGSGPRDKVAEPSREQFNLPGPAEEVIVQESHDPSCVASNKEVAPEPKGGDAREELHGSYGRTVETAGDPMDSEVLDMHHVLEIFEGASPVKRIPKQQPIGKYGDHTGIVAHDMLSRS